MESQARTLMDESGRRLTPSLHVSADCDLLPEVGAG